MILMTLAGIFGRTRVDIPETDHGIAAPRGQPGSVGRERHVQNGIGMSRQCVGTPCNGSDSINREWLIGNRHDGFGGYFVMLIDSSKTATISFRLEVDTVW